MMNSPWFHAAPSFPPPVAGPSVNQVNQRLVDIIEFVQTVKGSFADDDELVNIIISITSASENELQNLHTLVIMVKGKKCPLPVLIGMLKKRL